MKIRRANRLLLSCACASLALSPVIAHASSDPCSGPDQTIDLQQEMPPIDDQGQVPWCATYAAKSLLDYNTHEACLKSSATNCAYSSDNITSASAVHAFGTSGEEDPFEILKGAQYAHVPMQSAQPQDQSGSGGDAALRSKLADYYLAEELRVEVGGSDSNSCSDGQSDFADLLKQIPNLQQAADRAIQSGGDENAKLSSFIGSVLPQKGIPPFNVYEFETPDQAELMPHIVETLSRHQPLTASVCSTQLNQAVGIRAFTASWFNGGSVSCGPHAVTVIGFSKQGGVCQVHIRNSYGDRWPYGKTADGNAWVDAKTFLSTLNPDGNNAYWMTNIQPRQPSESPVSSVFASRMPMDVPGAGQGAFTGEVAGNGSVPVCGMVSVGDEKHCVSNGTEDLNNPHCCKLSTGEYPQ